MKFVVWCGRESPIDEKLSTMRQKQKCPLLLVLSLQGTGIINILNAVQKHSRSHCWPHGC